GLRPKTAARVIRFDRARRVLERNARAGRPNVAGVAAECGYFDQAHLIRDWQQFTGLAPTEWIAAEFRNFQVTSAGRPARSMACATHPRRPRSGPPCVRTMPAP